MNIVDLTAKNIDIEHICCAIGNDNVTSGDIFPHPLQVLRAL